ncbi:MAG: tetratricopeptide repeat protein [Planctomycetaceae bacterium]
MDAQLKRFADLPIAPDMQWHGAVLSAADLGVNLPGAHADHLVSEGVAFALWSSSEADVVHAVSDLAAPFDILVRGLTEFAVDKFSGTRPARLAVALSEDLAGRLANELAGSGTTVEFDGDSPVIARLTASLGDYLSGHATAGVSRPTISAAGCSEVLLRDYAVAAAAFYRSSVWRYFSEYDLLQVDSPRAPRKLKHFTVLGEGGVEYGLGLYSSKDTQWSLYNAELDRPKFNLASVTFDRTHDVSPEDLALWREWDLPLVTDDAFPTVLILNRGRAVDPDAHEVRFLTTLLVALANTTEAEIDSGKWSKSVDVEGELVKCVISIPDLLSPPTRQQWMKRGVMPETRSTERLQKLMHAEIAAHPGLDLDGMNAVIRSKFVGTSIDDYDLPSDTPYARADNLYYEALDNHGRRRIQLARQAVAESPQHIDAQILLAEATYDPEQRIAAFKQAGDAWRTWNQGLLKEQVGHFWDILETRPYIRALAGLAEAYERTGRRAEAIEQMREILRLNKNDNLGIRYRIVPLLLTVGRAEEARRVLSKCPEETGTWLYLNALTLFKQHGSSREAEDALRDALRFNPHVIHFLDSSAPPDQPDSFALGSPEEAAIVINEQAEFWKEVDGFLEFLVTTAETHFREELKHRREKSKKLTPKQTKAKKRSRK